MHSTVQRMNIWKCAIAKIGVITEGGWCHWSERERSTYRLLWLEYRCDSIQPFTFSNSSLKYWIFLPSLNWTARCAKRTHAEWNHNRCIAFYCNPLHNKTVSRWPSWEMKRREPWSSGPAAMHATPSKERPEEERVLTDIPCGERIPFLIPWRWRTLRSTPKEPKWSLQESRSHRNLRSLWCRVA